MESQTMVQTLSRLMKGLFTIGIDKEKMIKSTGVKISNYNCLLKIFGIAKDLYFLLNPNILVLNATAFELCKIGLKMNCENVKLLVLFFTV
jgi:hypothetical protein